MHPGIQDGSSTTPLVPTLYLTGSRDVIVLPLAVKKYFDKCPGSQACGFAEFKGNTHTTPAGQGSNNEIQWVVKMFDCKLKGNGGACDQIFKKGSGALCESGDTTDCEVHGD